MDGTVSAEPELPCVLPVKEHTGNGLDPHSPSLPEKLRSLYFFNRLSGNRPYNSLFDKFSSFRLGSGVEISGIGPESSLFCKRRVNSLVKLVSSLGIPPRMLLSDKSRRRSRLREEISGGISPEKSLPAR